MPCPSWPGTQRRGAARSGPLGALAALGLLFAGGSAAAAGEPFPAGAAARPLGLVAFTEGPAWHPDGNVYFSDVTNNRIMRRDAQGAMHVFRQPSGRANGLAFDLEGRLVACEGADEGGNRRLTRTEHDGTITVLVDRYQGHRFNAPNDLTIDSKNRIYFSDPRYGADDDLQQYDPQGRPVFGVYRVDPTGLVQRILDHQVARPNGLAVMPDDAALIVVDNDTSGPDGNRKLWRFELTPGGTVVPGSQTLLYDFGRSRGGDGLALDEAGRIYVAAGTNLANPPLEDTEHPAGIYVFSPSGQRLAMLPVPEDMVTNCAFGGADRKTLYITAGHKLWSVPVTTPGFTRWPPRTESLDRP